MLKRLVRASLSGLITACFAFTALTWGSMPTCARAGQSVGQAHHAGSHGHPGDPGRLPASPKCLVHLCCIQIAAPLSSTPALARIIAPEQATGPVAAGSYLPQPLSHLLPLAHAPPLA